MRTLWSNPSGQMKNKEKRKDTVDPYPEGVENLRKKTAKKESFNSPTLLVVMKVHLKITILVNPSDLSWHFPILVTIRELPFKSFRGRSPAKLKAKEDIIEEVKKKKTLKNRDEDWNPIRWKKSSWMWTTSSWREWSSDKTCERTDK